MGGHSVESVGPDFTGLFCGSEGLFGVALEITLRLLPKTGTVSYGAGRLPLAASGWRCGLGGDRFRFASRRTGNHGRVGDRSGRSGGRLAVILPERQRC